MGKPRDLANVVATGNILADGAVAPAELTGVTATAAEINILDGVTATAAELNLLDGVTATTAELNYVDGVTSNVQTQIDTKAPVAGPTFTGTLAAPTINASTALQIGGTAITATAAELNIMDGVTVGASDINSVTTKSPTADPTFTGTATAPTINASTALQIGGVAITSTAAELNYNDITTLGTVQASKVVTADANGDVTFGDSDKAIFGAGSDLQIYHDASHSYLQEGGTGALKIKGDDVRIEDASGNNIIKAVGSGSAELYEAGSKKLETTALGIDVTGELIADSYNETYVSLSAASSVAIDCHTGNVFALTTGQNTTFTFTNPPASGTAYGFTLKLTAGGGHSITYPNTVDFAGGTAPDAPASGETDVLVFITVDGGTNWYGALAIDAAG